MDVAFDVDWNSNMQESVGMRGLEGHQAPDAVHGLSVFFRGRQKRLMVALGSYRGVEPEMVSGWGEAVRARVSRTRTHRAEGAGSASLRQETRVARRGMRTSVGAAGKSFRLFPYTRTGEEGQPIPVRRR
jgi:hypothetical protein